MRWFPTVMMMASLVAWPLAACDSPGGGTPAGADVVGGGGTDTGGGGTDTGGGGGGLSQFTHDEVRRALLQVNACTGDSLAGDSLFLLLLTGVVGDMASADIPADFGSMATCLKAAADCPTVLTCIGYDPTQACDPNTFAQTCEGTVRVNCEALRNGMALPNREDCAVNGGLNTQCSVDSSGYASCIAGSCAAPGDSCDGAAIAFCDGADLQLESCGPHQTCTSDADGAQCVDDGGGVACEATRCEGNILVNCSDGFEGFRIDCAKALPGTTCTTLGGGPICGMPEAQRVCTHGEQACNGAVAQVCVGGAWIDFDCATWLNGTCQVGGEGITCIPPS
jgi:hypothetical protein